MSTYYGSKRPRVFVIFCTHFLRFSQSNSIVHFTIEVFFFDRLGQGRKKRSLGSEVARYLHCVAKEIIYWPTFNESRVKLYIANIRLEFQDCAFCKGIWYLCDLRSILVFWFEERVKVKVAGIFWLSWLKFHRKYNICVNRC